MIRKNMKGYGLWTVLLALFLLALISGGVLLALQKGVMQQQLSMRMQLLSQTIQFAQAEARRLGRSVWLCPVRLRVDGRINGCMRQLSVNEGAWAQGLLVYADQRGQNAGVYDSGEVVKTAFVDEQRYRLQVRQWRAQSKDRFMLLPLSVSQPQVRYGAWGWGEAEPIWLQLQLSIRNDPDHCQTIIIPPLGPEQTCQGDAMEKWAALCVCF